MLYEIRELDLSEVSILDELLYETIYQPEGATPLARSIVKKPRIHAYIEAFGRKDDVCFVLTCNKAIVGAVWSRIITNPKGYGSIDEKTPELAIALMKQHRGKGQGRKLLDCFLVELKERGYEKVSLSVSKGNKAYLMYLDSGFKVVEEKENDCIMVKKFNQ